MEERVYDKITRMTVMIMIMTKILIFCCFVLFCFFRRIAFKGEVTLGKFLSFRELSLASAEEHAKETKKTCQLH